jgi:hypothetical protein
LKSLIAWTQADESEAAFDEKLKALTDRKPKDEKKG